MTMKLRYILTAALALAAFTACHDFRDDYMVDDTVYLRSATDALVQDYSVYDALSRFGVIKSGKGRTGDQVTIGIAPTDSVVKYNERHSTNYLPLSKTLYNAEEIDGKVLAFDPADARVKVDVKWDPAAMVAKMTSEVDDFVIPIYIKDASVAISKTKYLLLIHPVLSTIGVREVDNAMNCKAGSTSTGKIGVVLDTPIPTHDVKVKLSYTPSSATVNGLNYVAAPEGAIKLPVDEVIIKAGLSEVDIDVDLDMTKVPDGTDRVAGKVKIESVTVVTADGGLDFMPVRSSEMTVRVTKKK